MTLPLARVTDMCTHGAVVITGSPDKYNDNLSVARLHDIVACPRHGPNPIISITTTQQTDNLLTAHVIAIAACGAVIITGSSDNYVG
jgi:uncharacterized Zn-binding protein involved in type VI secretion